MSVPHGPEDPPPFTGLHAVIWMSVAIFLWIASSLLLVAINPAAQQDLVSLAIVTSAAFFLTSALLLGKHPAGPRLVDGFGIRPTHPGLIPLGLILGVCAQVPATWVEQLLSSAWPMSEKEELARAVMFQFDTPLQGIAMVATVACLVPFAEESLFRGAIYGALRRSKQSGKKAAVITTIGFTLAHLDLRMIPAVFVVAIMLGFMRATSGSLLPCVAAHVGFNAVTMVGLVTGWIPASGLDLPATLQASACLLLLIGLLLFWWFSRVSPRAEKSREMEERVVHE